MKNLFKGFVVALPLSLASAPAFATCWWWCSPPPPPPSTNVPEIDASAGLLGLAALGAVMLLVHARRRATS
ncbi:VPEID-CTERM sorting domain-containing protein [Pseudoroseicyclus tamaricis]|uniref:VPEID-CTERM sorting domain-containing protein n=1 Tax=Pseudoroseicyclus tamaricis TaxID=2705421 RepID=A0A6B2JL72_9RHOB|nr:VPEID-CTERM sorting domain-containing protein [Pseudoroseicyclus tamaricis]NDV02293.1 VPEID-CTERM sorting domain-containing protein [Pseudoroseicyclus tamaricis]